jgi:hypothetical protein
VKEHGAIVELNAVRGALQAGATTVVFAIEHGEHDDYRSEPIPITVTP